MDDKNQLLITMARTLIDSYSSTKDEISIHEHLIDMIIDDIGIGGDGSSSGTTNNNNSTNMIVPQYIVSSTSQQRQKRTTTLVKKNNKRVNVTY